MKTSRKGKSLLKEITPIWKSILSEVETLLIKEERLKILEAMNHLEKAFAGSCLSESILKEYEKFEILDKIQLINK